MHSEGTTTRQVAETGDHPPRDHAFAAIQRTRLPYEVRLERMAPTKLWSGDNCN